MQQCFEVTHPEWHDLLVQALAVMDPSYLKSLEKTQGWLPGLANIFSAFSLPLTQTRYVLWGESPYPRAESANGYAFWDARVQSIWQANGLSTGVNRATSLRNLIKMLLVARGDLTIPTQANIAALNKSQYWSTINQLFNAMLDQGILLLNTTLVYQANEINFHAKQWQPFMSTIINRLSAIKPQPKMILLGKVAAKLPDIDQFPHLIAEHPYNISFITNNNVLDFFRPLDLLSCNHD